MSSSPRATSAWISALLLDYRAVGRAQRHLLDANRMVSIYVIDRRDGKLLAARPLAQQNRAEGVDARRRPIASNEMRVETGATGATIAAAPITHRAHRRRLQSSLKAMLVYRLS